MRADEWITWNHIKARSGVTWAPYINSLSPSFWAKQRDGLKLVDSVNPGTGDVQILLPYINLQYNPGAIGGIKTGIIPDANTLYIYRGTTVHGFVEGNLAGENIRFYTEDYGGIRWGLAWGDKTGLTHTNKYGTSNRIVDSDWHTFIIYDKRLWIEAPDISLTDDSIKNIIANNTPAINITVANWVTGGSQIVLLCYAAFNIQSKGKRSLTWIGNYNGSTITWQKKYIYTTHIYNTVYEIINGAKVLIRNNVDNIISGNYSTTEYGGYAYDTLNNGHSLCYNAINGYCSIPKAINGFINDPPTGYAVIQNMDGNTDYHNQADSKLRFPTGSIWNRSSATVWKDDARAATTYYDASNPTDWHISELNALIFYEWLQDDYKYILGVRMSPNSVDVDERQTLLDLFSFSSNLTLQEMTRIWKLAKDYNLVIV